MSGGRPARAAALAGLVVAAAAALLAGARAAHAEPDEELAEMSLEELMDVRVTSASNAEESLAQAPAQVIVLTRAELEQRGYRQLFDVFDDLPGMDVVRPYGDNWALSYWRGFRADVQVPFLVMIDGVVFNSLYYVDADAPLAAMPLTNIDRIEIVFGPASSVYGPNAFMGVVNVITVRDADEDGASQRVRLGVGSDGARILDATLFQKKGELRLSLSARVESGRLDESTNHLYELTRDHYYSDRGLWGGFVDNRNLGGGFRSRHTTTALDARLHLGETELGAQYYQLESGYGVEYAADRVQNDAVWARRELSLFARREQRLFGALAARLLVRYRQSGIPNHSYFVDGYDDAALGRVAAFSFWQARNSSWSALQDFSLDPMGGFTLHFGFKYERKDLTKAYDIAGETAAGTPGGYEPVGTISADGYVFPEPPGAVDRPQNRIETEDVGVYVQSKYHLSDAHHFHLGARVDRNSGYEYAPTVRAGYVGTFGQLIVKALYGQAFQEPPPRVLYGGWTGAGSDPDLAPERSQTIELGGAHTLPWLANNVSLYYVENSATISTGAQAENLGRRQVLGLDYGVKLQVRLPRIRSLHVWAVYTRLFIADEQNTDDQGVDYRTPIGDLADDKLHLGADLRVDGHASLSLRGRWIGERETVATNPVRHVGGYVTVDASLAYRDLLGSGLGLSISGENLTGQHYFHPGIADAGAGTTPGSFVGGAYVGGSQGYFSSLLPQPGRTVLLSLWLER